MSATHAALRSRYRHVTRRRTSQKNSRFLYGSVCPRTVLQSVITVWGSNMPSSSVQMSTTPAAAQQQVRMLQHERAVLAARLGQGIAAIGNSSIHAGGPEGVDQPACYLLNLGVRHPLESYLDVLDMLRLASLSTAHSAHYAAATIEAMHRDFKRAWNLDWDAQARRLAQWMTAEEAVIASLGRGELPRGRPWSALGMMEKFRWYIHYLQATRTQVEKLGAGISSAVQQTSDRHDVKSNSAMLLKLTSRLSAMAGQTATLPCFSHPWPRHSPSHLAYLAHAAVQQLPGCAHLVPHDSELAESTVRNYETAIRQLAEVVNGLPSGLQRGMRGFLIASNGDYSLRQSQQGPHRYVPDSPQLLLQQNIRLMLDSSEAMAAYFLSHPETISAQACLEYGYDFHSCSGVYLQFHLITGSERRAEPERYDGPVVQALRAGSSAVEVCSRFNIVNADFVAWVNNAAPLYHGGNAPHQPLPSWIDII